MKTMPVIYIQDFPGRYYARVAGDETKIMAAAKTFKERFGRDPSAAYIRAGFIYFPVTEAEASTLITLAPVD